MLLWKKVLGPAALMGISIFGLSAPSYAATISSQSNVEILALDGVEVNDENFAHPDMLEVQAGRHQVVFRYYGDVRKGQRDVIYSTAPDVFTIDLKQDDSIKILAPRLNSYTQAEGYFRRGADWKVQDQHGNVKSVHYEPLTGNGVMPFNDIERAVARHNAEQGNEFAPAQQAAVTTPNIAAQRITPPKGDDTLIQTIQLLYNNASPAQQQKIKAWIAGQ
ncbi:hypothetical protein VR7878_01530 [Vibrio ruber DSM 16370]|uniref:DUF2057 domain-containing protein n=1 Tax=Vibrio ruber (strain DSM 16370 / JCM 11486 / BCRC 17186 / CECT 7878 / LMG 23124 / VR1) TaxID=1123498 RepID=A0A1R4LHC5_VIBR1|nr:DUF2057 domain-containing protein [Vibrio ruber]SJN55972.1 hypothetical protein VR7878_01530 [Vibrio ruber DSM 16370]